jgi:HAMP domain-containing protein
MGTTIAIGANPARGGAAGYGETALMAAFAVVGLVLLFAAVRLIRRRPRSRHADRYMMNRR